MEFTLKKKTPPLTPPQGGGVQYGGRHEGPSERDGAATTNGGKVKFTGGATAKCVDSMHSRTAFAIKVYPELKNNERQACKQVVSDIYANIRQEMQAAGWRKSVPGYTDKQLEILNRFYSLSPRYILPVGKSPRTGRELQYGTSDEWGTGRKNGRRDDDVASS